MRRLEVLETIQVDAPVERVRAQFGDVAHHAETGVHRGVSFDVITDDGETCHYRQTTQVGPLRLTQELELTRPSDGELVNRVVSGQFAGGAIMFSMTAISETSCAVEARISPLRFGEALAAPLLRRTVRRSLRRALIEDRADIESGAYGRAGQPDRSARS